MKIEPSLFEQILSDLPDCVIILDRDFNIIYQNASTIKAFGSRSGEKCYHIYEQRDQICEGCGLQEVFKTGKPALIVRPVVESDNSTSYWENSCFPLFDSDGEIVAGVEICRNITDRVALKAEVSERNQELEQKNSLLRCIIDSASDLIFVKDRESHYQICNKASETFIGQTEAEQIGKSDFDFFPPEVARQIQENDQRLFAEGLPQRAEEWATYPDGSRVLFDTLKTPVIGPQGEIEGLVGICRDITERRQVEDALCSQQHHAQSLLRLSKRLEAAHSYSEAISATRDEVRNIIGYSNLWAYLFTDDLQYADTLVAEGPASDNVLGEKKVERLTIAGNPMLEKSISTKELVIVEDARVAPHIATETVERLGNRTIVNVPILLFDHHLGTIITGTFGDEGVRVPSAAERDYLAALSSHLAVALDRIRLLSESKKAEEDLRQMNRKLRAISNCNQLLMRVEEEQVLLDEICRIICEEAGYLLAWIGYAEEDEEKTIRPMSRAGRDSDYVADISVSWAEDGPQGQGPAGTAIRSGETICVMDIASDSRMQPWWKSALQHGYRAGMALPLKNQQGKTFGVLLVYSGTTDVITPDEVELLEELAGDLAFGIGVLRERSAKAKAQRQIELLSFALNNVHEGAFLTDRAGSFHYVNDEACRSLGYNRDELLGMGVFDIDPDFTEELWKELLEKESLRGSLVFETRHKSKAGQIFPVEISTTVLEFEGEEYGLAMARDISERKLMEDALFFVAQRGWLASGENFFDALAQFLGARFEMDYVFIDRLEEDPEIAETVAIFAKGTIIPNLRYALKGTPCENVMGKRLCVYPQGIQELFPEDTMLAELGAESYIGIPLWDSSGQPIGLIALLNSRPLGDEKPVVNLLQLVATRAAAELERVHSDRILQTREREFRALAENSPDCIARYDSSCRTLYINPALEKALGRSMSEVLGTTPVEAPRIKEFKAYQEKITEVLSTGNGSEIDLVLPDRGAGLRYHNVRFVAERKEDGAITGVLAIGRDITEHREAEKTILASFKRFEELFNKAAIPLCLVNKEQGKLAFNSSFEQIFGYSGEEVPTLNEWWQLAYPDPDYREQVQAICEEALQKALSQNTDIEPIEYRVTCKNGDVRDMVVFGSAIGEDFLLTFFDVTERKANLRFFECMDQVNQAIQKTSDPEQMMGAVLDQVLDIFACDRAYLLYPCDPKAESWRIPIECTRPEYPGGSEQGKDFPMTERVAEGLQRLLDADGALKFGPGTDNLMPEVSDPYSIKSFMAMAIHPKLDRAWQFGIHQCSYTREWTEDEERLFEAIGHRIADGLTGLLSYRNLRENEQFLDNIVESLPNMLFVKDAATLDFVRFNKAGEQLLGYKRNELIGYNDHNLFPPEIADFFTDNDRRVLNAKQPLDIPEEKIQLRNGEERILHTQKIPLLDNRGEPQYLLGISEDITEHVKAEAELRKLTQAIEQSPVSIVITDTNGRIEFVNPKFTQITGYSYEEVLGQNPRILKTDETSAEGYRQLWQTISNGGIWSGEFLNRKKNHDLFWEHATIAPIRNSQQIITHYVAVKEDITERKKLEAQLQQSQRLESVGQLAGGVAHDFNNMLAVILGRTQLAMKKIPPVGPLYESLQEIRKAAERSTDLTRQLLAFARKQVISPKIIDLNDALTGMLKMLRRLIGEDIDLAWLPANKPLLVNMDSSQLDQILVNLCINARDAIEGTGRVTIEIQQADIDEMYCTNHAEATPGEYILLVVSDDGQGMDGATCERIFEPFFTTKEVGAGTGLGLATVYGIVKQNNGFINVYSEPGQGSTFKVYLPRLEAEDIPKQKNHRKQPVAQGNERVLLVEDEPSLLSLTQQMLESCGYQVLAAATTDKAIKLAKTCQNEIQLLISDVVMPGLNGPELKQHLTNYFPHIKCLYMSGYTADIIHSHGVLEEGIQFLQKPFTVEALAGKVREILDE